ncbi:Eco29kI family restriction endonuclease [Syntrophus sp. (in: bacteria)]|uniref:Eco29kI family restriction endonuclease n=1 Tax=Syntrophus sp. (in: bacteria) TaxID=48412 RepID=UPI00345EAE28
MSTKAVPPGARKGNFGLNSDPGLALYRQLQEHAESIAQATNLNIEDFYVDISLWMTYGFHLARLY